MSMAAPATPLQPAPGPAAGSGPSTSRSLPHFIRAVEPFGKSGLQSLSGAERIKYLDQFELGTVPSIARMQADGLCPFFERTPSDESASGVYTVAGGEEGVRRRRRRRSALDGGKLVAGEEGGSVRQVRKRSRTDEQMKVAAAEMPDPPPAIKQWACASLRSQGVLDGVEAAEFKHNSPRKRRRRRQDDGEGDGSDSDAGSRAETSETASDLEAHRDERLNQLPCRLENTPSSPTPVRQSRRRLPSANKGDLPGPSDLDQSYGLGTINASSSLPRSSPATECSTAASASPVPSSPSQSRAAEKRYEALLPRDPGYDQLFEDFGGGGGDGGDDDDEINMEEDRFSAGVARGLTDAARSQAWSSRIRSDCEENLSALTSLASSRAVSPAREDLAAAPSSSSLTPRRDSLNDHASAGDISDESTSARETVAGPSNDKGGRAPSALAGEPVGGKRRGRPRQAARVEPSEEQDGGDGGVAMDTGAAPVEGVNSQSSPARVATQPQAWYSRIRSDCESDLSPLTSAAPSRAVSPAPNGTGSVSSTARLDARNLPPLYSPATGDSSDDTTSADNPVAGPSTAAGGSAAVSQPARRKGKGRPHKKKWNIIAQAESAPVAPRDQASAPLYSHKKALVGGSRAYRFVEAGVNKPESHGLQISDNYDRTKRYMQLLLGDGQVRLVSKDREYVSFTLLSGHAPVKIDFALGTTEVAVGQYVKIRYSPATLQPSLEKSTTKIEESRIRHGHHLLTPEEEAELEWEALSLDCVRDLHRRDLELYICDAIIGLDTFSPKRKHKWLDPRALARCKAMDKTPRLKLAQTSADVEDWQQGKIKVNIENRKNDSYLRVTKRVQKKKDSFSCPVRRDRRHLVMGQSLWRVEARGDDFDLFPREEQGSPLTTLSYILSPEDLTLFRKWSRSVSLLLA